jgi:hypothetical protein
MRVGCIDELSFGTWTVDDALPDYDDEVTSFGLDQPYDDLVEVPVATAGVPVDVPHHPSFPVSAVVVPIRSRPFDAFSPASLGVKTGESVDGVQSLSSEMLLSDVDGVQSLSSEMLSSEEEFSGGSSSVDVTLPNRHVKDLWFYEQVLQSELSELPESPLTKRQSKPPQRLGMVSPAVAVRFREDTLSSKTMDSTSPVDSPGISQTTAEQSLGDDRRSSSAATNERSSNLTPWILQAPSPHPLSNRFSVGDGCRTCRFIIHLMFPGGELPDQPFAVTNKMTVRTLRRALASLMGGAGSHGAILMYVGPS